MREQAIKGAASAASTLAHIAQDFVAIGGRLMVAPSEDYEAAINHARVFPTGCPDPELLDRYRITRAYIRAEKWLGAKNRLKAMVRENGDAMPNGWLVWRAC